MKRFLPVYLLLATLLPALGAQVKISDLPLSTAPSTNTFLEIADMDAVTKSSKYLLTNLVTGAQVPSYQTNATLASLGGVTNSVAGITNALGYVPVNKAGDTMTGALTFSDGLNGATIGTGSPAFTFSTDPNRVPTTPVAVLRPTTTNSAQVLDLMPNGLGTPTNQLGTGAAWIDLINRDLRLVSDTNNWNVARLSVQPDGTVYVGAWAGGTNIPGTTKLVGSQIDFRGVGAGGSGETLYGQIQSGGNFFWSTYFAMYSTLGAWFTDKGLSMRNKTVPLRWYNSAVGLTSYCVGLQGDTNGVVQVTDGSTGSGSLKALQYQVAGTTNQVVFGATNTAPVSSAAPTKWISVQVSGESTVYRLPLYE